MILRDYQQQACDDIDAAWARVRNVAFVLPCRGGKTPVIAKKILANQGWSVAIVHRAKLVAQMSMTLARNGVRHRIIGSDVVRNECIRMHVVEFGKNYVDRNSRCAVASVDTLIKLPADTEWFPFVTLWLTDEVHHLLLENKWGIAVSRFPNARGLGVTATLCRADGKGLGRYADGVLDEIVLGPNMRGLINAGFIADYRIFAPPSDLDLSGVPLASSGEYSYDPLRKAVHKSHIVGDIVQHYLRIAPGKLGMTFAVDVESATEIAQAYRAAGVPAEAVSADTPTAVRFAIERKHQAGDIKQIVSVDLYGEGVDIQTLEVLSMGRPTQSYGLYVQQFCRPLNYAPGKVGTIIDHVGNVHRHGLPDAPREWSLDRRERRARGAATDVVPVRTCPACTGTYDRVLGMTCPYCGETAQPASRSAPEFVDGDLYELDAEALARMRGEIDAPPAFHPDPLVARSVVARHRERTEAQTALRAAMAQWAGRYSQATDETTCRELQRRFFVTYGVDVLSAQALGRADADALRMRIEKGNGR